MTAAKPHTFGFGVDPTVDPNHYYVLISADKSVPVQIYERYGWTEDGEQQLDRADVLRLELSKHKWDLVSRDLMAEFNARLKKEKKKQGRFSNGGTPVAKLFGKELMVLLWAIEDCDPSRIPTAVRNWKGLMPEERWWLYTMTNASTGHMKDKRGWRVALRYALCENPVEEGQGLLFRDVDE